MEDALFRKLLVGLMVMENNCWEWQKARFKKTDYGMLYVPAEDRSSIRATHRLMWELIYGPIPEGICVCHKCDNPPCCNPAHLFLGTHKDNAIDRSRKGRGGFGIRNGNAKLTDGQVSLMRKEYDDAPKKHGMLTRLAKKYDVDISQVSNIVKRKQRIGSRCEPEMATKS